MPAQATPTTPSARMSIRVARPHANLCTSGGVPLPSDLVREQCRAGLDELDENLRANSASLLGELGTEAQDDLPFLRVTLVDPAPLVRFRGAEAIGSIATAETIDPLTVTDLEELLSDEEIAVQLEAAKTLIKLDADESADKAVDRLIELAQTEGEFQRLDTCGSNTHTYRKGALLRMAELESARLKPALPLLRQALNAKFVLTERSDIYRIEHQTVARAIGGLGEAGSEAVPDLIRRLAPIFSPDPYDRDDIENLADACGRALVKIGKPAHAALLEALGSRATRKHAAQALAEGAPKTPEVVNGLLQRLNQSVLAGGRGGHFEWPIVAQKEAVVDELLALANDQESPLQGHAVYYLGRIGLRHEEVVSALNCAMERDLSEELPYNFIWHIERGLAELSRTTDVSTWPKPERTMNNLFKLMTDSSSYTRNTAGDIMSGFGEQAVPVLIEKLRETLASSVEVWSRPARFLWIAKKLSPDPSGSRFRPCELCGRVGLVDLDTWRLQDGCADALYRLEDVAAPALEDLVTLRDSTPNQHTSGEADNAISTIRSALRKQAVAV